MRQMKPFADFFTDHHVVVSKRHHGNSPQNQDVDQRWYQVNAQSIHFLLWVKDERTKSVKPLSKLVTQCVGRIQPSASELDPQILVKLANPQGTELSPVNRQKGSFINAVSLPLGVYIDSKARPFLRAQK